MMQLIDLLINQIVPRGILFKESKMKRLLLISLLSFSSFAQESTELCKKLVKDGSGTDAKVRTEIMKLSHSLNDTKQKSLHEDALIKSLLATDSKDVATFILQQLEICGTEKSLKALSQLLNDESIGENSARTLTELAILNSSLAADLLIKAYESSTNKSKSYLLNSMAVLKLQSKNAHTAFKNNAGVKTAANKAALAGLAGIGNKSDSKTMLNALKDADAFYRTRAFRLNLIYSEKLADTDKTFALQHLEHVNAKLKTSEVPFKTGILSVKMKINGISQGLIKSLASANIHTQTAFLRMLRSKQYGHPVNKLLQLIENNPEETFYLKTLASLDSEAAKPHISKALNSTNETIKSTAIQLANSYGPDFAPALVKALMSKGQLTKDEILLAKSMIHPAKVSDITALWNNLSPELELSFIEMTEQIRQPAVARKMLDACKSENSKVKRDAQKALKDVVGAENYSELLGLMNNEKSSTATRYLQAGLASSIAQSDNSLISKLVKELSLKRNDKLLVAFAKSNRPEVLPLLEKDLLSKDTDLHKETIKSLSSMEPSLSSSLLILAIEKSKDDRNKILAVRALASAISQSTESNEIKIGYINQALAAKPAANEEKMLRDILKKISSPKMKKRKAAPKSGGYSSLFSGKDLKHWENEGDYKINNGVIYGTKGRLWSKKDYKDFSLKFEFKLHPATNNGLAIRTPKGKKPIELQIIDNSSPKYAKIKDYQRHGSMYSYAPAKTGFLKKQGEWNQQEVICKGSSVKVILNGTIILDVDLKTVKQVPGSKYKVDYINNASKGRIGFLGHRTPIEIRNVLIKEF